jgi:uncharacterized membrane protein YkoI
MRAIERIVGMTIASTLLAAGPALAAPAGHSPTIGWTSADAVAAERVPGDVVATRLRGTGSRAVYDVDIRTADERLERVQVDAHDARVLGVHPVQDPGVAGEIEAP